jgi:hypothetical protein
VNDLSRGGDSDESIKTLFEFKQHSIDRLVAIASHKDSLAFLGKFFDQIDRKRSLTCAWQSIHTCDLAIACKNTLHGCFLLLV